jgi:hypothetical protein
MFQSPPVAIFWKLLLWRINQFTFSYALVGYILIAPSAYVFPQCERSSLTTIHNTWQPWINYVQKHYRNSTQSYQVVSMTPLNKSPFQKLLHQRPKHKLCTNSWPSLYIMRKKWKKRWKPKRAYHTVITLDNFNTVNAATGSSYRQVIFLVPPIPHRWNL